MTKPETREAFITVVANDVVLISINDESVELDEHLEPIEAINEYHNKSEKNG